MTTQRRYELRDEEWEWIRGYFPQREASQKGRARNDDRKFSTVYFGLHAAELHGGIYRSDTERGVRFIVALHNGRKKE